MVDYLVSTGYADDYAGHAKEFQSDERDAFSSKRPQRTIKATVRASRNVDLSRVRAIPATLFCAAAHESLR